MSIDTAFPDAVASYLCSGGQIEQLHGCPLQPVPYRQRSSQNSVPARRQRRQSPRPPRELSQAELELIESLRALANSGLSITATQKKLGIGTSRVGRLSRVAGIQFARMDKSAEQIARYAEQDAKLAERIRAMANLQCTHNAIRTACQISTARLQRIANTYGINLDYNRPAAQEATV